ncbi:MAG: protein-L-isoaspartate(D-aspartate) O-methyltransferase, partial [Methylocystis sp.]|nr:protein-L-isoaspartate(D-aspartate) O-methyltransferase [Methylocystis sp.]
TMEAPAVLARRLEALAVEPHHRVLEVGTGSGFSAAVLARLAAKVVSIERFETLAIEAAKRLAALAIANVRVLFADGLAVSPALGPFDRAILHMSVERAPQPVQDLLAPGGVMIFGRREASGEGGRPAERLLRLERDGQGAFHATDLGPCWQGAALDGAALAL